jgi:hypothetical protein
MQENKACGVISHTMIYPSPSHAGTYRLSFWITWWRGCWLVVDWSMTWLLTWHVYCAWWLHHYIRLMSSWAMLLYMMMSQLHHANVIPHMSTVHDDVTFTSCWRHAYPSQPHGSGQLVFGSGQLIRVKKTRGARLHAWTDALPESDGECGHVRRSILTPFSPLASSLPPLYSGMVKTQFWQLSFLSKNQTPL